MAIFNSYVSLPEGTGPEKFLLEVVGGSNHQEWVKMCGFTHGVMISSCSRLNALRIWKARRVGGKSTSVSIGYVSAPIAVFAVPRTVSVHKLRVDLDDTDSKPDSDSKVSAPGCRVCWTKGKRCLLGFITGFHYWRLRGYVRFAVLVFDTRIGWADCYRRMPLQWILIRSRNVWMNTYPNDAGQSPTFWRQRRITDILCPFHCENWKFPLSFHK